MYKHNLMFNSYSISLFLNQKESMFFSLYQLNCLLIKFLNCRCSHMFCYNCGNKLRSSSEINLFSLISNKNACNCDLQSSIYVMLGLDLANQHYYLCVFGFAVKSNRINFVSYQREFSVNTNVWLQSCKIDFTSKPQFEQK